MSKKDREKVLERFLVVTSYVCADCGRTWGVLSEDHWLFDFIRNHGGRRKISCPECFEKIQPGFRTKAPSSEVCLD